MISYQSLSDNKSSKISRTLFSILADLYNVINALDGFNSSSYFQVL